MIDVLQLVEQVRTRSAELNSELARDLDLPEDAHPIGGLNMVGNRSVVTLELLSFYHNVWSSLSTSDASERELHRKENGARVIESTKAMFVLSISSLEFSAKRAMETFPGRIAPISGRVYLGKIIGNTVGAKLLPKSEEDTWRGILALRNALVHNNGIADHTATYPIPGGPVISFKENGMTQGNLRFFPEVTLWCVEGFARWCRAIVPAVR